MEQVTLLGATGSIGRSALDVIARHPERFRVHALAGGSRVKELAEACRRFRPARAAIADASKTGELAAALREAGLSGIDVSGGAQAIAELARDPDADTVVQSVVGAAGVPLSFAAARAGKRLLLANKESIVCGGGLLMRTVREGGAALLPVDSEHCAIFQCLQGASEKDRRGASILLTASGGPFRGRRDLSGITPEQAVAHPKWSMGRKISVDSATLMNKGLEVIEARWLFDVPPERIRVAVHPQSIVHSAVEFPDGAVIAQLGTADMRLPIAYCLGWPERLESGARRLTIADMAHLTFEEPDTETFPLLRIAFDCLREGGGATVVLNAANEAAVGAFLSRRIGFADIARTVEAMLSKISAPLPETEGDILELDRRTRAAAADYLKP